MKHFNHVIASPTLFVERGNPDSRLDCFTSRKTVRFAMTALILFLLISLPAFAETTTPAAQLEPYPFTSTYDAARFSTLTHQVRCIVCQHQSIADSNTPIADGLRRKIYQMVLDKKSDNEIKDYLVKRYGEFILLNPRMGSNTILLWGFPFIGLAISGLIFIRLFSKRATSIPTRL